MQVLSVYITIKPISTLNIKGHKATQSIRVANKTKHEVLH